MLSEISWNCVCFKHTDIIEIKTDFSCVKGGKAADSITLSSSNMASNENPVTPPTSSAVILTSCDNEDSAE